MKTSSSSVFIQIAVSAFILLYCGPRGNVVDTAVAPRRVENAMSFQTRVEIPEDLRSRVLSE